MEALRSPGSILYIYGGCYGGFGTDDKSFISIKRL